MRCLWFSVVFLAGCAPVLGTRVVAHPRDGRPGVFELEGGGEILFRGINVNSLGEYWQFDENLDPVFPFIEEDMDRVAAMGLNLVRLVLTWSRVEPEPGVYDAAYLDEVGDTVDGLWERGIYTLVDLHQDAWGPSLAARPDEVCGAGEFPATGWDGAPAWATLVDEATPRCAPIVGGHPIRESSPAVSEAWSAFLNDSEGPGGVGLQERFTAMLAEVAIAMAPHPGVMGMDLLNEPNAMFSLADMNGLRDLYILAVGAIRDAEAQAGSPARILLFEPSALWPNVAMGSTVEPFSDDPQLAYGPHIYQGSIGAMDLDEGQVQRIRDEAASYGGAPVLTGEWGLAPGDAALPGGYLERMIQLQDQEHWSTAFWLYQSACGDPHFHYDTVNGDLVGMVPWGLRQLDCSADKLPGEEHRELVDRLARPALHLAPSIIASLAWDRASSRMEASGSDAERGAELQLFLPAAHRELSVSVEGLRSLASEEFQGGLRYTARAKGGSWSLRVEP